MFKGLIRGVQLMVAFLAFMVWSVEQAVKQGKTQPLQDGVSVAGIWIEETTGTARDAQGSLNGLTVDKIPVKLPLLALIGNGDPWARSRKAFQDVDARYPERRADPASTAPAK